MREQWFAVIYADTGEVYSFGTEIADPMPDAFLAIPLPAEDAAAINEGRGTWDAATRSVLVTASKQPIPHTVME